MARADIYRSMAVKRADERQMASFIGQSSRMSYVGEINRQLEANGYTRRIRYIDHADVLSGIDRRAAEHATLIRTTYNQRLRHTINAMPRGWTDAQVKAALGSGFIPDTRAYNLDTLFPFIAGRNHAAASLDFMQRNGIRCKWRVVDPEDPAALPDRDDVCLRDMQRGIVDDPSEFEAEDYPAHRYCPHRRIAVHVDPASLPDESAVWTGSGAAATA